MLTKYDILKILNSIQTINRDDIIVVGSSAMAIRQIPTMIRDIDIISKKPLENFDYINSIVYGNDKVNHYKKIINNIAVDVSISKKQYNILINHSDKIDGFYVAHPTHILLAKLSKLALQISAPKQKLLWMTAPKNVMDILSIYYYSGIDLNLAKEYIESLNLKDILNILRFCEISLEVQIGIVLSAYPLKCTKIEDTIQIFNSLKSKLFYIIDEMLN